MFDNQQHEFRQQDDGPELPAHLAALERQLARLSPAAARIDRDRLMFDAGRACAEASISGATGYASALANSQAGHAQHATLAQPMPHVSRFWPAAAATMTAASLLLSALLIVQSGRSAPSPDAPLPSLVSTQQLNTNTGPAAIELITLPLTTPWTVTPESGYLTVRQVVLARGVSVLDRQAELTGSGSRPLEDSRPPATARNLLEELLPSGDAAGDSRI